MKRKFYSKPAKRNNLFSAFLLLILLIFGCSKADIPEDTLIKVYVENTLTRERYIFNADSLRFHKQLIYNKYKISEKEVIDELKKYSDDKEKWEIFFKKANEYLNTLAKNGKLK